jgi:hypothetical protein
MSRIVAYKPKTKTTNSRQEKLLLKIVNVYITILRFMDLLLQFNNKQLKFY